MKIKPIKNWILVLLIFAPFFLAFRWEAVFGSYYSNIGLVILNDGKIEFSDPWESRLTYNAIQYLMKAVQLQNIDETDWRWIGYYWENQGNTQNALDAWKKAKIDFEEYLWWGQRSALAGKPEDALSWYSFALTSKPDVGDVWYYYGLVHESLGEWDLAANYFQQSVEVENFQSVPISSAYYRLGLIYHRRPLRPNLELAMSAYNESILLNDFRDEYELADSYYGRGELFRLNGQAELALSDFSRAKEINPTHEWAYLGYALAQFSIDHDILLAEKNIQEAISIWPDKISKKWPYIYMGNMQLEVGNHVGAIKYYEQALFYDSGDNDLRERVDAILLNQ